MTTLRTLLAGLLALLFLVLGLLKVAGHPFETVAFQRWGYPDWFRVLTGVIELGVAGLLLLPRTRRLGALLYAGVMVGAVATHLRAGEQAKAGLPLVLLVASLLLVRWLRPAASPTRA